MQSIAVAVNQQEGSVYAAASNATNGGNGSTGIYKSTDCGATWTAWNTGAGQADLATGQLWAMLIDPMNPQIIYVANGYGSNPTLYRSQNGGVDFSPLKPDVMNVTGTHKDFVQAVAIDPGNSKHIAVTFHDSCGSPFNSCCFSQSTDSGDTWTEFNGPSQVDGWQEAASLTIFGATNYFYTCGSGAFYTGDGGKTWSQVIKEVVFGRYAGSTDTTPDGRVYVGAGAGTYYSTATTSSPIGSSWTAIPNSPNPTTIIDDGVNLYSAQVNGPPFFSASVSSPMTWTQMSTPSIQDGSNEMARDPAHHIIYSANFENGLYRLVTQ
jgi:hypothetical protein